MGHIYIGDNIFNAMIKNSFPVQSISDIYISIAVFVNIKITGTGNTGKFKISFKTGIIYGNIVINNRFADFSVLQLFDFKIKAPRGVCLNFNRIFGSMGNKHKTAASDLKEIAVLCLFPM